ncbi:MAG: hypothetical protein P1U34_04160 [Coxiellaceae bacterium]|nr:hypothetical protein [Coxiellaceae bacterium]
MKNSVFSSPKRVKSSHWHSFLYFSSAFIGMSCGRCVAELAMVATNYFANDNVFNEDDHATQGWMLLVAVTLGLVVGLSFARSHNQAHAVNSGNILLSGLKAGKVKFTDTDVFDFRENREVFEKVSPLAATCASQIEMASSGFDKCPVIERVNDFKQGLVDTFVMANGYDKTSRDRCLVDAIMTGLTQLNVAMQEVIDAAFDQEPLIKAGLLTRFARSVCCLCISSAKPASGVLAPMAVVVFEDTGASISPLLPAEDTSVTENKCGGGGDDSAGIQLAPYVPPGQGGKSGDGVVALVMT